MNVVFRKWENGHAFALLPNRPAPLGFCASYHHGRYHTDDNYALCVALSLPATVEECRVLETELQTGGGG